jgi:hypothetical protein
MQKTGAKGGHQPGKPRALSPPVPSSVHPSQLVVVNVWPKTVVVPIPPDGESIENTRRAGFDLSEASRYGAALNICKPLETNAAKAITQNQWLRRVVAA